MLCAAAFVGRSAPAAEQRPDREDLRVALAIDLPITLGALALWVGTEIAKPWVGPVTCRWCDTPGSLNRFDALGRAAFDGRDHAAAARASDVLGFGVAPVLAIGLDLVGTLTDAPRGRRARRFGIDVLLIAEATTTAMAANQLAKFALARRRPSSIDEPSDGTRAIDENLSYYSGHTTLAFALASSAGMVMTLRHARIAPAVWALGLATATTTAMLRVAGDRHYASDVLTGAVIGSAIGVLVPLLHRAPASLRLGGSGSAHGGVLSVSGVL